MMANDWVRVTKRNPCPVCKSDHWCGTTPDGKLTCCMRVESSKPTKNGGWLHGEMQKTPSVPRKATATTARYEEPGYNTERWLSAARKAARLDKLTGWAASLGLPVRAIDYLGACTVGGMLCFPMHDGTGKVCGIRTRTRAGAKRAVTGSRAGVFLPTVHMAENEPIVCEGPTDAAAAEALGFEPIGRPSCLGSEVHVVDTCKRFAYERITICADGDGPGVQGAEKLGQVLRASRIMVRMVAPVGYNDLRDWRRSGVTRKQVDAAWSAAEWRG